MTDIEVSALALLLMFVLSFLSACLSHAAAAKLSDRISRLEDVAYEARDRLAAVSQQVAEVSEFVRFDDDDDDDDDEEDDDESTDDSPPPTCCRSKMTEFSNN